MHYSNILEEELIIKINLQLFAEPEEEGRTEEPTEKKKREAREKGKVAKTQELSSALVMLISFFVLSLMGKTILGSLMEFMRGIFSNLHMLDFNIKNYRQVIILSGATGAKLILPVMISAVFIAFMADMAQVGFQFSSHPIKPELSKISFTFDKLWQRIGPSRQVLVNLSKAVLKIVVISSVAIVIVRGDYAGILKTIDMGTLSALKVLASTAFKVIIWISIILIVFSLFDYIYQRWEHLRTLKMTLHEVKEERKQYEGDPMIKARQRERFRSMIMRRIIQEVPKADVIVTNPTHYAVALQYDPEYMTAAQVTAKGVDLMAKKIKDIAGDNSVPIIENRPLARALYAEVEVGEEIPGFLFEAVAEVLSVVYRMKEEAV